MRCLLSIIVLGIFSASIATASADETAPLLIANGRVDDAIAALHGQISASPNDAMAHNLLCRAYFSVGQWDSGISECEKAVALAPNNGQFHLWLGRIYGEKADQSSFMTAASLARRVGKQFEAAVQLSPQSIDAHSDLAEFYLEAPSVVGGGREKAEQQANRLASLDPASAHWVLARIAEKHGDFGTAEREYREAINLSRGSASSWLNLGLFYKHRSQFGPMEQALSHVRSSTIDRPDALVDAAEILIHTQRNLPEAVELLHAYLNSNTKKVEQAPLFKVHYLLGSADEKLGAKEEAAAEYKTAVSMAREFRPAQEALQRMSR
ncbi:MAG TPA: tetratricopeptide repeat protein [Terriglobales bacterium]|nr:tetratricopeptide repeat protein [Terriglobales bacterium]